MSFLTKYLHQPVVVESAVRDTNGKVILNKFGEIDYSTGVTVRCRKETHMKDIQTATGSIIRSETTYAVDESKEIFVDDKLDGHVVLGVDAYISSSGSLLGWRCYV